MTGGDEVVSFDVDVATRMEHLTIVRVYTGDEGCCSRSIPA